MGVAQQSSQNGRSLHQSARSALKENDTPPQHVHLSHCQCSAPCSRTPRNGEPTMLLSCPRAFSHPTRCHLKKP